MLKVINAGYLAGQIFVDTQGGANYRVELVSHGSSGLMFDLRQEVSSSATTPPRRLMVTCSQLCRETERWRVGGDAAKPFPRFVSDLCDEIRAHIHQLNESGRGRRRDGLGARLARLVDPGVFVHLPVTKGADAVRKAVLELLARDQALLVPDADESGDEGVSMKIALADSDDLCERLAHAWELAVAPLATDGLAVDFAPHAAAAAEEHLYRESQIPAYWSLRITRQTPDDREAVIDGSTRNWHVRLKRANERAYVTTIALSHKTNASERFAYTVFLQVTCESDEAGGFGQKLAQSKAAAAALGAVCYCLRDEAKRHEFWASRRTPREPDEDLLRQLLKVDLAGVQKWWQEAMQWPTPDTGSHVMALARWAQQEKKEDKLRFVAGALPKSMPKWVQRLGPADLSALGVLTLNLKSRLGECEEAMMKAAKALTNWLHDHAASGIGPLSVAPCWRVLIRLTSQLAREDVAKTVEKTAGKLISHCVAGSLRESAQSPARRVLAEGWLAFLGDVMLADAPGAATPPPLAAALRKQAFSKLREVLLEYGDGGPDEPPPALAQKALLVLRNRLLKSPGADGRAALVAALADLRLPDGEPAASLLEFRRAWLACIAVTTGSKDTAKRDSAVRRCLEAVEQRIGTRVQQPELFQVWVDVCNRLRKLGVKV